MYRGYLNYSWIKTHMIVWQLFSSSYTAIIFLVCCYLLRITNPILLLFSIWLWSSLVWNFNSVLDTVQISLISILDRPRANFNHSAGLKGGILSLWNFPDRFHWGGDKNCCRLFNYKLRVPLSPVLACWSLSSFIFSEVALFIVLTSEFVMTFSLELGSLLWVGGFITESLVELPGAAVAVVGMIPEMIQLNTLFRSE